MTAEPASNRLRKAVSLPSRAMTGAGSSSPTRPPRQNLFAVCVRKCFASGSFLSRPLRGLCRKAEPWMFLAGAGLCIMLTLLLRIVASAPEMRSALSVADAANVPAADVPADPADQLAPPPIQEPVQRPRALGSKPNVPSERQNRFKLLLAEELEALNAQPRAIERGPAVALAEGAKERSQQDPILGGQNRNGVPGA